MMLYCRYMITERINFNFAARYPIQYSDLASQTIVSLIDIFLPILVMMYNLKAISFDEYTDVLLRSLGLINYKDICSIFLRPTRPLDESAERQNGDNERKENDDSDAAENDIWIDDNVHSSNRSQVSATDQSESLLIDSVQR